MNFGFAAETNWVIATEKFDINLSDDISKSLQTMIPERILGNLSDSAFRTIMPDEELERESYKLKNERISLFLQLSSANKNRDAIFLQNYSDAVLKSKLSDEQKKIDEIQKKIDENIKKLQAAEKNAEKKSKQEHNQKEKTEFQKYLSLFKGIVSSKSDELESEKVSIYNSSNSPFFTPSANAKNAGYKSREFEKEITNAKIQSLVTGKISVIENYLMVSVELFVYPGAKSICTVNEIGSLDDLDFIASSLARQLSPKISASLPVKIFVTYEPSDANLLFSVDDIIFKNLTEGILLEAGVHVLRFDAENFQTAITSYYFEGNTTYNICVELQEKKSGELFVKLKKQADGDFYSNGIFASTVNEENPVAKISINDSVILGQFINSDELSGFFYVPEKLMIEDAILTVNTKALDRNEYIEKRRKWMYSSYSVFFVSLLSAIVTYGNYYTTANAFNDMVAKGSAPMNLYNEAKGWQTASGICIGVTVGTGVLFGYELVRYFMAANSVLPAKAKKKK